MKETLTVTLLAVSNVLAAAVSWVEQLTPYMDFLIRIGQVGVAVVTIVYIVKKIKNMPKKTKP